jgi:sulfatase maturation enzyme AslB (radical SAM superfamily)
MSSTLIPSHSEILKDILSGKNKTFCTRPFLSVTAHQDGAYRLCCEDERVVPRQILGNVKNIKIPEMKNSEKMKELRKKMLEWKSIIECNRCRLKESRGIKSLRQKSNDDYFSKYLKDVVYSSDISTWETSHPSIHADIRFSNICNLACRMCYSGSSSSRMELDKRLGKTVHSVVQDIFKIDDFSSIVDELKILYIAGGEPLIDKNFIPFLDYLIDSERSQNIGITINTNLTVFSETHRELLSHFLDVRVVVSCDGYGDMYEYIRIWAKWDTFLKNIVNVKKSLASFGEWSGITMNTVVQMDNVVNILQLHLFCHKIGIKHNLSMLQVPESMYIWVMPIAERIRVLKIYKDFILKYSSKIHNLEEKLSEIMWILASNEEQDEELHKIFLDENIIIDWYISDRNK